MARRDTFWTDDKIARLAKLRAEKRSWKDIGDALGVSHSTVRFRAIRYGIVEGRDRWTAEAKSRESMDPGPYHEQMMARGSSLLWCRMWDQGIVGKNAVMPTDEARQLARGKRA